MSLYLKPYSSLGRTYHKQGKGPFMQEYTLRLEHATTIALDQHAKSVTLATLDLSTGETRGGRLADCPSAELIVGWAKRATEPVRFIGESALNMPVSSLSLSRSKFSTAVPCIRV